MPKLTLYHEIRNDSVKFSSVVVPSSSQLGEISALKERRTVRGGDSQVD